MAVHDNGNVSASATLKRPPLILTVSLSAAWAYVLIVLLFDETAWGIRFRYAYFAAVLVLGLWAIRRVIRALVERHALSQSALINLGLAATVSLITVVVVDIGATISRNLKTFDGAEYAYQYYFRLSDSALWQGEFWPRLYYPTEKNFQLHKPNTTASGELHGIHYSRKIKESVPSADQIFRPRRVSFSIDRHGFRETTLMDRAEIFALGDSFTFGYGVDQDESWVERLEASLEVPVYNLGVEASSPKQQTMLLDYLLTRIDRPPRVRRLLWMIFEGNDLDDSLDTDRPLRLEQPRLLPHVIRDTVIEYFLKFPYSIKSESVLHTFRAGIPPPPDVYERVVNRLYYSPSHGYKFFWETQPRCTARTASYVQSHPHRAAFEETFREMASLARRFNFTVTVLLAPCEEQLYTPYFDGFPPITEPPHVLNFIADLSRRTGFETIDLLPLLRPYAEHELLYFRDDAHWNERGHAVVAGIVADYLRRLRGPSESDAPRR